MEMDSDSSLVDVKIDVNNFPAKLWHMTNDPKEDSVFWTPNGSGLVVDQQLFQKYLLSPTPTTSPKFFKTSNFNSFIRQLNLYGFHKVFHGYAKDKKCKLHHFFNQHFKQGQPELLVHLKRLTTRNRIRMTRRQAKPSRDLEARGTARSKSSPNAANINVRDVCPGSGEGSQTSVSHQLDYYKSRPVPAQCWPSGYKPLYPNSSYPVAMMHQHPFMWFHPNPASTHAARLDSWRELQPLHATPLCHTPTTASTRSTLLGSCTRASPEDLSQPPAHLSAELQQMQNSLQTRRTERRTRLREEPCSLLWIRRRTGLLSRSTRNEYRAAPKATVTPICFSLKSHQSSICSQRFTVQ
ncbi:hypothetical protein DNTS_003302 [Danionella cerebrum]|uniref:HSF-type DNA-binding domain-containing protein n=1 Tax=Danionella cerebrum TaxID=2873325 RepID=A0A553MVN3_9TELE|nr:hypothetical protein DNTS_003302 [Danionella translucida]